MENEELAEGQVRMAQQIAKQPKRTSIHAGEAAQAAAGLPINSGETSPLLGDRSPSGTSPPPANVWYDPQFEGLPWYKRPGIYWLVGPWLILALAFGGIIVTKLTLIEDLLCDQYFSTKAIRDPTFSFMPIVLGEDNRQCKIPEVSSLTAEFMLVASLLSGIPSAIVAPILGAYSDRWGRTRVLAIAAVGSLVGELITILVAIYPQTISVYWILVGYFFEGLSGSYIVSMAIANAYASDVTPPPKRARAISFIYGCLFGGIAFGPLLSAQLVSRTGNLVAPFYFVLAVHSCYIPFMAFLVPESVPDKRQITARQTWDDAKAKAGPVAYWKQVTSALSLSSLRVLWPKGPGSSSILRRNLVLLAAVDTVCFGVAMGAMTVVLVYTRQAFNWDHAMTQYYVSIVNICRVAVLLAGLPAVNRLIRGKSGPDRKHGHTGADNIDLGFIRVGVLFDLLGFLGFAASKHGSMFIASGALAAAGGVVSPTLSSAMTRHMPAHLTGQLLGALGLLHALARIISPAIFNGIFALTAKSFPQAVFVCLACAFGVAEFLSWFVKSNVYFNDGAAVEDGDDHRSSRIPTERDLIREEEDVL